MGKGWHYIANSGATVRSDTHTTVCYSYLVPERRNHLVHDPLGINNTDFLMSRLQRVLMGLKIEDRDKMFKSYWKCFFFKRIKETVLSRANKRNSQKISSMCWHVVKCVPPRIFGEQNRDPIHELSHSAITRIYHNQTKPIGQSGESRYWNYVRPESYATHISMHLWRKLEP